MNRSAARSPHALLMVENVSLARDHRLQKQAGALVSAGFRVSVVCRRDPDNAAFTDIAVHEYPAPPEASSKFGFAREYGWSLAMGAGWMARLYARDRFDVMQISGTPDIYFLAAAPFRRRGCPVVLDQRDLSPELYELRYGKRGRVYDTLCRLERASYRAASQVIVVNESLAEVAEQRGGVSRDRITIVRNGPLLSEVSGRAPKEDLKAGRRYLCCWVGFMGPQDQVLLAVDAISRVVRDMGRRDCQFVFIGDGEVRSAAQQRAAELDIEEYLSFPGWLPRTTAFDYLATADIALEPNLEDIVTPVKGMEYMAFGLPFVAFDVSETRRMAGAAAAYAPRGDVRAFAERINDLLDDPARRAEMAEEGVRRIRDELAWDHQSRHYVEIFDSLVAGRGKNLVANGQALEMAGSR